MASKIDGREQFADTPQGWHARWMVELEAADDAQEAWREKGRKVQERFRDERDEMSASITRLNLFTANIQTQRAMLYGRIPSADVSRKFGDPMDDVGRVAGEILERVLNNDIERDGDGYKDAVGYALDDRLLPGLGVCRVRYTVETEEIEHAPKMGETVGPDGIPTTVELAPGYVEERKVEEDAETDYVGWEDFRWSPCRVWSECRWVAFRVWMTREDLIARFGEDIGRGIPLDSSGTYAEKKEGKEDSDPWGRAEIWEIWCKDSRRVYWISPAFPQILDVQDDTLDLEGFFPCPRPLAANLTTKEFVPLPDFCVAQDQYDEVDEVSTRISTLQRAVAVRGVYDSSATGIRSLLSSGGNNELIPVDSWAAFAEKGGVKGQIDWLPLEMIVGVLAQLEAYRDRLIMQVYQITGMSDIMRGQAQVAGTATEQAIKARFASVRMQAIQDEVSRFASELLKLRAEIITKHFDPETIVTRANMLGGKDQEIIGPALQLLKSEQGAFRIEVKPENINLADAAAMKNERMEFMAAIGGFVANTMPLRQADPAAAAMLNEVMGWALASFKGSAQIEGSFDRYTASVQAQAMQPRPPPMPPPQLQVAAMKAKGEQQKIQATLQADLMRTQAETQAELTKQRAQAMADVAVDRAKEDAKLRAEERRVAMQTVSTMLPPGSY